MSAKISLNDIVQAVMTIRRASEDQCKALLLELEQRTDLLAARRQAKAEKE